MADLKNAIYTYSFHFADRRLSQLLTLQAAQVTFIEPESAVSTF